MKRLKQSLDIVLIGIGVIAVMLWETLIEGRRK